jgi:hypothetical protein
MGKQLFGKASEFGGKVSGLITEHGITHWERHPYTDIWPLMEKFGFSCLNLAAGYHRYHTDNEYVVVDEVQNGFELGLKLHKILGENFYERVEDPKPSYSHNYGYDYGYGSSSKTVLNEGKKENTTSIFYDQDEEDEEDGDNGVGYNDDDYDYHYKDDEDFSDLWDYDEFNGGYSIRSYETDRDDYLGYDW